MTPRRTELADGSARPRRDPGARSFARGPEEDTSKDQDLHMRRPSAGTHRCAAGTPGRHSTGMLRRPSAEPPNGRGGMLHLALSIFLFEVQIRCGRGVKVIDHPWPSGRGPSMFEAL